MDKKKVLRLIFRQPTAHYRVGFTQYHLHRTLPLPPPSTIIGMVHNIMGVEKGNTLRGFDIALCGKYESIFYQYQLFRDIGKPVKRENRARHPGVSMPNQVQLLNNVYLRVYLEFEDFDEDAPSFIEKFENPSIPFFIGRREDLAILENIEIKPQTLTKTEFPDKLGFNYWVSDTTAREYDVRGPVYLLGTYYEIEEDIRNFDRRRFYYIEPQPLNPVKKGNMYTDPVGWVDKEEINGKLTEIPVFFLGINKQKAQE